MNDFLICRSSQAVDRNDNDLQILAESVSNIMESMRDEIGVHIDTCDTRFKTLCDKLITYVMSSVQFLHGPNTLAVI